MISEKTKTAQSFNLKNLFILVKNKLSDNKFQEEYIIAGIFFFGALAAVTMWITDYKLNLLTNLDKVSLPILAVIQCFCSVGLWKFPQHKKMMLLVPYVAFSLYIQASWVLSLFMGNNGLYLMATVAQFLPIIYLTAHFCAPNKATLYSWLNYFGIAITGVIGMHAMQEGPNSQLILSTLVSHPLYLVALHFIMHMRSKAAQLTYREKMLSNQLITDPLTGISNRIAVQQKLDEDDRLVNKGIVRKVAVFMIDVDFFKKINDNFGHGIGDQVLKEVGIAINSVIRTTNDIAGRWGGEEFVVIASDTTDDAAKLLGERIRLSVENMKRDDLPSVTVSVGIATRKTDEPVNKILEKADVAVYRAKSYGRNQVVLMD